jgi:hypothetical protein
MVVAIVVSPMVVAIVVSPTVLIMLLDLATLVVLSVSLAVTNVDDETTVVEAPGNTVV